MNDDFASGDDADADHLGGTGHFIVVGLVACKGRQLQERGTRIEQRLDSISYEHLVLPTQTFKIALRPGESRSLLSFLELSSKPAIMNIVGSKFLRSGVGQRNDALHFISFLEKA